MFLFTFYRRNFYSSFSNILLDKSPKLSSDFIGIKYTSNGKGTVRVGDGTTTMNNAISLCPSTLTIPDQIADNGVFFKVTEIGRWSFYNCDSLTSVTIGCNVITIGEYAFSDCDYLSFIAFDKRSTLREIGSRAFSWCQLTTIELPASVRKIGDDVFNFRGKLKSLVYCGSKVISNKVFCKNPPVVYVTDYYRGKEFGGVKVEISPNVCLV